MGEIYDTATRLDEGLPALADVEQYVAASRAIGFQHAELTAHAGQLRDRYAAEAGMDLRVLDADCTALSAAAAAVDEALARQDDQLGSLTAAWQGSGADASREFLRRHGEASAAAASAVRAAADALADLRDRLWHAVDGKVASVLAIDDGVRARRADWLAAAQTVTTGAGDRAAASELVDHEVKPFVANVIGEQWLAAMRAAVAVIEAAYDDVTAQLTSGAEANFAVPGELGPTWSSESTSDAPVVSSPAGVGSPVPVGSSPALGASSPAPVVPAAWTPSAGVPPQLAPPQLAPPAVPPPPMALPESASPAGLTADPGMPPGMAAPALPASGGGLPDIGSGLSGFGQQLSDILGGLLGDAEGALDDEPELDDPELDGPELDDPDEIEEGEDPEEGGDDDEDTDDEEPIDGEEEKPTDPVAETPCEPPADPLPGGDVVEVPPDQPPEEPAATPPPEPVAAPAPEPPASPPPEPMAQSGTPCEIAAGELPQVGQ